jgi:hypothetical protein
MTAETLPQKPESNSPYLVLGKSMRSGERARIARVG